MGQISDKTLEQVLPFSGKDSHQYHQEVDAQGNLLLRRETASNGLSPTSSKKNAHMLQSLEHYDEVRAYFDELTGGSEEMHAVHVMPMLKYYFKEASFYHRDLSLHLANRMADQLLVRTFGLDEDDPNKFISFEQFCPWYHHKRYEEWPKFIAQVEDARAKKAEQNNPSRVGVGGKATHQSELADQIAASAARRKLKGVAKSGLAAASLKLQLPPRSSE
eukprot:TRINITY_DN20503_c0_g1_i1.p1 TRINITY_DN20503_c0_g1~~TRINITY_DN20503_c0_g1_i1.p1  ORF type:complete len:219 (-),score=54.76 TRINITY_DN20503_c0_g1_i1:107-763(-)